MLNRKYFPFERNSYYFGKLLTARDFEAEQKYMNDKRRFVNRLTGANGIVAGLGVITADDASVILQAGCAFDASGREIVVPETKVIKLSTIDGFSQLTSSCAYLGISYDEQFTDEVYSVMNDKGSDISHNKVREQYKLTLLDENLVPGISSVMDEFVSRLVIYADQDVEVAQYTPKFVPLGSDITVRTEIKKLSPGAGEYSFAYKLNTPDFKNESGQTNTELAVNNLKLAFGERKSVEVALVPEGYIWGSNSSIAMTVTDFIIQKNDEVFTLKQSLESVLKPVNDALAGHYLYSYYNKSMDNVLNESYDERLWIARISLIRQNTSVIIDRISPAPFNQYCYNAQQLMTLRRLEQYYPVSGTAKLQMSLSSESTPLQNILVEQAENSRNNSCGVFEFPLGLGYDQREPLFSDEIMHGLGKGPVYVQIGIEYISVDKTKESMSEILLGDTSIFSKEEHLADEERIYNVSTAVKVLPERGTFVAGLRLGDTTGLISLRIRWFAFRLGEVNKQIKSRKEGEKMIMVNPDTIVLTPKSTAHISPVFINMPTEACVFSLVDAEGGSIDNNGIYTAPTKEGVYEIRVEAISDSAIYTHVFAIVSQKKKKD